MHTDPDFTYVNHGTVWTIKAVSADAIVWANEHFAPDGWQGRPTHFTTDHRAARDVIEHLKFDGGFSVEDIT